MSVIRELERLRDAFIHLWHLLPCTDNDSNRTIQNSNPTTQHSKLTIIHPQDIMAEDNPSSEKEQFQNSPAKVQSPTKGKCKSLCYEMAFFLNIRNIKELLFKSQRSY